jgi:hypothetical protein
VGVTSGEVLFCITKPSRASADQTLDQPRQTLQPPASTVLAKEHGFVERYFLFEDAGTTADRVVSEPVHVNEVIGAVFATRVQGIESQNEVQL